MSIESHSQVESSELKIYEIRVQGRLREQWEDWFDGLIITQGENNDTLLTGPIIDQAMLYGVLKKVRDLGLPLLSVNSTDMADVKLNNIDGITNSVQKCRRPGWRCPSYGILHNHRYTTTISSSNQNRRNNYESGYLS